MAPFYWALDALERHAANGPVTVLQVGDSHTANDGFSGRMRDRLQARFGDAGRGLLPPGIPFRLYRPAQVAVTAKGWRTIGALAPANTGPWGLALVRQHADGPAVMTLQVPAPGDASTGWAELLAQPGGGSVRIDADDGGRALLSTDRSPGGTPIFARLPTTPRTTAVTLAATGDGPVDVLGWSTGRDGPGIRYGNLGPIGATVDTLGRIDPAILADEMQHLHPALLIVAFGTNDGFSQRTDTQRYAALYEQRIRALLEAAPGAALLVVLPPDGVHREADAGARSCDGVVEAGGGWATPTALPAVRAAQVAVARRDGWAQWDWQEAMAEPGQPDGRCAILPWAQRVPPFAAGDHVHLLRPGYQGTAGALFAFLMRGYALWRSAHPWAAG